MSNPYQAEMAVYIRREKEIEKKLQELREEFKTWKERVELAKKADRPELAARARKRIDDLRFEGNKLRHELQNIVEKKKEIRVDSRRPTGVENRRAQALLKSFRESGIVDPDDAQLQSDIDAAAKDDDTELEALKVKAGLKEPSSKTSKPEGPSPSKPTSTADEKADGDVRRSEGETTDQQQVVLDTDSGDETDESDQAAAPDHDLDAELAALRQKMGDGTADDVDDVDVDELEDMLSDEDE